MTYSDEDSHTAVYYKDAIKLRFDSTNLKNFRLKTWAMNNFGLGGFVFDMILTEAWHLPPDVEWGRQISQSNRGLLWKIQKFMDCLLSANIWEWEFDETTVLDTPGVMRWHDVVIHNVNDFLSSALSTIQLLDMVFSLPSDVTIDPSNSYVQAYPLNRIISYRFRRRTWENWSNWKDIDWYSVVPFHLLRPALALIYYFDWKFQDVEFDKTIDWLYCYTDPITHENSYYRGDDDFWLTHGFPNGRKYRLFQDGVCKDGLILAIAAVVMLVVKQIDFVGAMKDIAFLIYRLKQGKLKASIDDLIDLLKDVDVDEEDRLAFINNIGIILNLIRNAWKPW